MSLRLVSFRALPTSCTIAVFVSIESRINNLLAIRFTPGSITVGRGSNDLLALEDSKG